MDVARTKLSATATQGNTAVVVDSDESASIFLNGDRRCTKGRVDVEFADGGVCSDSNIALEVVSSTLKVSSVAIWAVGFATHTVCGAGSGGRYAEDAAPGCARVLAVHTVRGSRSGGRLSVYAAPR